MRIPSRSKRSLVGRATLIVGSIVLIISAIIQPSPSASALYCDPVTDPLPSWLLQAVSDNKPFYVSASNSTGVPWEMLAAIHYRETSFSHTNPWNGQGIFQFVNGDGGPYPPGPVSDDEFVRQLTFMANRVQNDYVFRGSLNYTKRKLVPNEPDAFRVQDTLFSYNGRANVYAQQAADYGFSPTLSPYEGSPYVMNRFDCPRLSMGMITRDYGNLDGVDQRYGAFTLYARLKGDSYQQSLPSWLGNSPTRNTVINSQAHVGFVGWMDPVINNGIIGTTGQSKSIEAISISGEVKYSTYNDKTGWQSTVSNGMLSGSTGTKQIVQAVKINPIGSLASRYDIYYRAHVSYVGWMEWTKNGSPAGITGSSSGIEAIEIQLVPKGWPAPQTPGNPFIDNKTTVVAAPLSIDTTSYVGYIGWQPPVINAISGLAGKNTRIEAITLKLNNSTGDDGGIVYSSHLANIGWTPFKSNGETSGTIGQSRQMEALRIALTGTIADKYDVWYRGYVRDLGWQGWGKNGMPIGSVGSGRALEAVEVRVYPKGSTEVPLGASLYNPSKQSLPLDFSYNYSTHVSYIGWVNNITDNVVGGTTGQSKALEAIKLNSVSSELGGLSIVCSAYSRGIGWKNDVTVNDVCGTTGKSSSLESFKLSLDGSAREHYTLQYRAHIAWLGWQDWVDAGTQVGTPDSGKAIEAIQTRITLKY